MIIQNEDGSITNDGKSNIQFLRKLVNKLLSKAKIYTPPINLNNLIRANSEIKVKGDDLGKADGASVGKNLILFNNKQVVVRQRFTVAHELGHIILGHNTNGSPKTINTQSRDPNEVMANRFAAELLIPEKFLRNETLAQLSVSELAAKYWVSKETMVYRIKDTIYINKIFAWD